MSDHTISRRGLIGASAAAGVGAALGRVPGVRAAARRGRRRRCDVAIVGAGFAGLTAARDLRRAGKSVIVLEARNRVGGRALNKEIGGGDISERGATFVGPTQDYILALAKELSVAKFRTFVNGDNVYVNSAGKRSTYSDTGPTGSAPPDPAILPDLARAVVSIDRMSTEVPVDAPWEAPNAAEWDQQTLATWLRDTSDNPQFRDLVSIATRAIFGSEPSELSFLFVLFYVAASGNEDNPGTFERNFNTRDGAQMWRLAGGSQRICLRMARELGDRIVLRAPVRSIAQHDHRVILHTRRFDVHAKRAIVAVPPTLAARIAYHPRLPSKRDQLTQRLPQGNLIKATAVYDEPFWRDAGLNGSVVSFDGPANTTFDDSPHDGSKGVVFGFIGGNQARSFSAMTESERRAAVLANFRKYFGQKATRPREYFETNWAEKTWTRGCPVGIAGPGTLTQYGPAIREPVGKLHWAGTETSTFWNGYMDGAVRSGKRAAQEVLDSL
jgi:monoamine oxidase